MKYWAVLVLACHVVGCTDKEPAVVGQGPSDDTGGTSGGQDTRADTVQDVGATDASKIQTSETKDALAKELASEDAGKLDPCELPAALGCACVKHTDCEKGACVLGACATACTDTCPKGFACASAGNAASGLVCLADSTWACQPCTGPKDCAAGTCQSLGDAGSFCALPCEPDGSCAAGYTCKAAGVTGPGSCHPTSGTCECNDWGWLVLAKTSCSVTNAAGVCGGQRLCTDQGLSPCDAATPAAEVCNGKDDDCKLGADDGLDPKVCCHQNGDCDDGNACTADTCALATFVCSSVATNEGGSCNDGNVTTEADTCTAGTCAGKPKDCSKLAGPCTLGIVNTATGDCQAQAKDNGTLCDDLDACTSYSDCQTGQCVGVGQACVEDRLSVAGGVAQRPSIAALGSGYVTLWAGGFGQGSSLRRTDAAGSRLDEQQTMEGHPLRLPVAALPSGGYATLTLAKLPKTASTCYPGACPWNTWARTGVPLTIETWDASGKLLLQGTPGSIEAACFSGPGSSTCNGPSFAAAMARTLVFSDGSLALLSSWRNGFLSYPLYFTTLDAKLEPAGEALTLLNAADFKGQALIDASVFPDGTDRIGLTWVAADGVTVMVRTLLKAGTPEAAATTVTVAPDAVGEVRLATFKNGRFLVLWQAFQLDGAGDGIRGQRFNADGSKLGDAFAVNKNTASDQRLGEVGVLSDYGFVVAYDDALADGDGFGVVARAFNASAEPVANPVLVNAVPQGEQYDSTLAVLPNDELIVAFHDANGVGWTRRLSKDLQPIPGAVETRAHDSIQQDQAHPAGAVTASGTAVVVYEGKPLVGKATEIQATFTKTAGGVLAKETLVNTTSAGAQTTPSVSAGGAWAVVAWTSEGQDGSIDGVYARRFSDAGAALTAEIPVNVTTEDFQTDPSVAMAADGSFVVAWTAFAATPSISDITARLYDTSGKATSGELVVNTTTAQVQDDVVAAAVPGKAQFVLAWSGKGLDGDGAGIAFRRLNGDGSFQGDEAFANLTTAGDQRHPTVAVSGAGRIGLCWESFAGTWDIRCQLFKLDTLAVVGPELTPHAVTSGQQQNASACFTPAGDLVVVWQSEDLDGSDLGLQLARFDGQGTPVSPRVTVNRTWLGAQRRPFVVAQQGALWVGWESDGQDGDGLGIYTRTIPVP